MSNEPTTAPVALTTQPPKKETDWLYIVAWTVKAAIEAFIGAYERQKTQPLQDAQ